MKFYIDDERNPKEWAEINKIKIKRQRKVTNLGGGVDKHQRLRERTMARDRVKMSSDQFDNCMYFK